MHDRASLLKWMAKKEKLCMECGKRIYFWQRTFRLLKHDYCIWHLKCKGGE